MLEVPAESNTDEAGGPPCSVANGLTHEAHALAGAGNRTIPLVVAMSDSIENAIKRLECFSRYRSTHGACCNCVKCGYDKDYCLCMVIDDIRAIAERDREFIEAAEAVALLMDVFKEGQADDVHEALLEAYRKRREAMEKEEKP
jgi:hypothetical protein